jgi:DNA-binding transcriptional ArsR family regulator
LSGGEAAVGEIVEQLRIPQPQVSRHLGVLRTVDLVRCRTVGRHHIYRVNAEALRPLHDWIRTFEAQWNERLDRLDDVLAELQP